MAVTLANTPIARRLLSWRAGNAGTQTAPGDATLLQTVKPFIAAGAVIVTGSVLIGAIYFTLLDLAWIAFLGGVLVASILAMTTHAARAEIAAATGAGRLGQVEYQLGAETAQREKLERQLARAAARLRYADETLPAMLAFVDHDTCYRYHNRAFGQWLGLQSDRIDGQHMRDVLGRTVFAQIEPYVFEAAAGRSVRYERTHAAPDGSRYQVAVQYLPQFGNDGEYTGFHVVMTRIAAGEDALAGYPAELPVAEDTGAGSGEWLDASRRILAAINGNEFTLYCQRIAPVAGADARPCHHEVLIRLLEEESGLVPPGAFFSLAEEHGLLPQLDRWVFAHVFDWMATPVGAQTVQAGEIYFINVAAATLSDPGFADFIELQLRRTSVPGSAVCIEIAESDLVLHQGDAVAFARQVRQCGCRIAISGFGRDRQAMAILKLLQVDFLKIDSSIVRQVAAYPIQLAKAVAISKLAKAIGVRTIAEMVEDSLTQAALVKAGVDYAQGFGIALPHRLDEVRAASPAPEGASILCAA